MSGNVRPSMLNIISRILHKADGSVLVFRRENCIGDTFRTVMQQVSHIIFTLLLPLFVLLSLTDMAPWMGEQGARMPRVRRPAR